MEPGGCSIGTECALRPGDSKEERARGVLARMLGLGHPNKSSPLPPGSVASCFITPCPCWVRGEELAGGCRGAGHLGCAPSALRGWLWGSAFIRNNSSEITRQK